MTSVPASSFRRTRQPTLTASVRRRRRDLALLKTLGFTRRQLAAAVSWQSTVPVAIGTALGVPLGIAERYREHIEVFVSEDDSMRNVL